MLPHDSLYVSHAPFDIQSSLLKSPCAVAGDDPVFILVPPPDWHRARSSSILRTSNALLICVTFAAYCFIPELEAMTVELLELEDQDEQAELEAMASRGSKSSRTRTRQLGADEAQDKHSLVEAFVKKKELESAQLYKVSEQLAPATRKLAHLVAHPGVEEARSSTEG
jgi:hypothetical protein